jgi:hypothetical protein
MTFLEPLRSILIPFLGFDALVSLVLATLMAGVILQNRRKNQSIATDIENLIRRYIVFRGHRQALMKFHQKDEALKHEILRTVSTSWNHFKTMLEKYTSSLEETNRRARNFLLILGAFLVLNSLRNLASGDVLSQTRWASLIFVVKELPLYLFLITGFVLIRIQSHQRGKGPLASFNSELDVIFSDTEQIQEVLNDEFDPIEQSFPEEET